MCSMRHRFRGASLLMIALLTTAGWADDRIRVNAELNNRPLRLILDTGADDILIFRKAAEGRGLKISPSTADSKIAAGEVRCGHIGPVKFKIFGNVTPNAQLSVCDQPSWLSFDCDGVIGWPIIRHSIWRLNGTDRQFSILKAVPSEAAEWVKLKERTDRKLLTLELPQENLGQPAYIGIDSGSDDGITLFPEQWTRWRSAHPRQPVTLVAYFNPAAGIVVSEVSWAEDVDLFGLTLRGVAISRANPVQIQLMPTYGRNSGLGCFAATRCDIRRKEWCHIRAPTQHPTEAV